MGEAEADLATGPDEPSGGTGIVDATDPPVVGVVEVLDRRPAGAAGLDEPPPGVVVDGQVAGWAGEADDPAVGVMSDLLVVGARAVDPVEEEPVGVVEIGVAPIAERGAVAERVVAVS